MAATPAAVSVRKGGVQGAGHCGCSADRHEGLLVTGEEGEEELS